MSGSPDGEALRALVREVLADLLPATPVAGDSPSVVRSATYMGHSEHPAGDRAARPAPARDGAVFTPRDGVRDVQPVSLRTDAELAAFVTRLLHLFENPKHRADLRSGRLRFQLAAAGVAGSARPTHRIEQGAVTEAAVREAARAGARLVLGRRAVLTPLARDRARAAGVEIEKER
ncbi:MAG: hypothetical protein ACLPKI_26450 [Streptosporangiaceae bacterium]